MEKFMGIHLYVNIKNILNVIKQEEEKDEDLKRTIHRLQTYFVGFSKLIKLFSGQVEKYTGGRAHVVFKINQDDKETEIEEALKTTVACFIYNNNIFNAISKYTQYGYPNFNVHAGMDYGEYVWYEIVDGVNNNENTTIGGVANNAAKVQTFADKDYIYIVDKLYNKLTQSMKFKFSELDESEMEEINGKIRDSKIYKAKYNQIFDDAVMKEIEEKLEQVKEKVNEEANKLNISEIDFSDAKVKVDFSKLSINNNKKLDGGILCADIRGFTKLFNKNDSNLDDLCYVMEELYNVMGQAVNEEYGVKVQYQGDRIVALFNDIKSSTPLNLRMIQGAFKINERVQELNRRTDINEKLKKNNISVGIGCSSGNIIATRLGSNGEKANILLSDASKQADKCEDNYANKNTTVISKELYDEVVSAAKESNSIEFEVLKDVFSAISKTGYYSSNLTFSEFQDKINEKKEERANNIYKAKFIKSSAGVAVNAQTRPWGLSL